MIPLATAFSATTVTTTLFASLLTMLVWGLGLARSLASHLDA